MYKDIKLPIELWCYCQTLENPDVCRHKEQTSHYVDIELPTNEWHHCQTIENSDVCGYK